MSELSDEQKKVFKDAAERRKAAGIKLGRWCVMLDKAAIESINEYWDTWVRTLGKERATDYFVVIMRNGHEKLRAALVEQQTKKRGKKRDTRTNDAV